MVLESTCNTPGNRLYAPKEFFFKPIYQRILRNCTMALLCYYDQNPFRIFLSCFFLKFGNLSEIQSANLHKKAKS